MNDFKTFIEESLKSASKIASESFGKVSGTVKKGDSNQVLTEADLKVGSFFVEKVKQVYPEHNVIDEEAGVIDNGGEFTWVIDPIDGTSNFAEGVPHYGIIIGLLQKDIPIAGGVALPAFSEICVAEKGKGAYCNGEKLAVSEKAELLSSLVAYGIDGHQENPSLTQEEIKLLGELILNIRNLRATNSAFDGVMLIKGKYGGYLNRTSKIWDNVGMQILVEEAGGVYTDFFGEPIDYSNPLEKADKNFTFCAASPALHKEIQKIIHAFTG